MSDRVRWSDADAGYHDSTEPDDVELSYQVIHLLLSHFSEDVSGLIVLADGYATAADLESSLSIPATPRLILLGETESRFQRWMLSLEGQIVCEGIHSTFVTGLASFFPLFLHL